MATETHHLLLNRLFSITIPWGTPGKRRKTLKWRFPKGIFSSICKSPFSGLSFTWFVSLIPWYPLLLRIFSHRQRGRRCALVMIYHRHVLLRSSWPVRCVGFLSPTEPRRRAKGVLHPLPVAARMQAVGLSASEVGKGSDGEGCRGPWRWIGWHRSFEDSFWCTWLTSYCSYFSYFIFIFSIFLFIFNFHDCQVVEYKQLPSDAGEAMLYSDIVQTRFERTSEPNTPRTRRVWFFSRHWQWGPKRRDSCGGFSNWWTEHVEWLEEHGISRRCSLCPYSILPI